ncbi:uracil-DNA glycosylase family protein [Mycobacteroides chelonae]|uniref:uracil-DNA glycosylase family protein n=1 Tax=Mycobacteroides chelonae TaxID=1774 RepID=UPI0018B01903|nr:uracil-DNA glycosylase family protein [Mycobacteroides chelonae]MBF9519525.1 uracil-DNA glycosylase [Mycobacteroides chelonae]
MATDTRRRQLNLIAKRISACRQCPGMNQPGVTASAPGYGSAHAPVAIVGQSLCRKCMESGIPFTGGSGSYIDRALELAGREKREMFITNLVHCHPPKDRKSRRHEIDNCLHFLHEELDVLSPQLIIGLGGDAEKVLTARYPDARLLPWPFAKPRTRTLAERYLLFPEHPGSLRFKKTADRAYYSPSLARAITWGFEAGA